MLKDDRIGGTVTVQPLFLILLAISLLTDAGDTTLCILLAVLLHEGGHLLVMRLCRVRVCRISLEGLRIEICSELFCASCAAQLAVCAGGVLMNIAAAVLLIPIFSCHPFCKHLCYAQCLIAAANLIPLDGLDGGDLYRFLIFFVSRGILQKILQILRILLVLSAAGISVWMLIRFRNPVFAAFLLSVILTQRKGRNRFDGVTP